MRAWLLSLAITLPSLASAQSLVPTSTRSPARTGTQTATSTSASGSLSPAATSTLAASLAYKKHIAAVIRANMEWFEFCYRRRLGQRPDLEGEVVLQFTIGLEGAVTEVSILRSSMGDGELEACLVMLTGKLRFPPPERVKEVKYPFIFRLVDGAR